jgi:hypothetical protein
MLVTSEHNGRAGAADNVGRELGRRSVLVPPGWASYERAELAVFVNWRRNPRTGEPMSLARG